MVILVVPVIAAIVYSILPLLKDMLETGGAIRKNYCGNTIPTGLGVAFIPAVLVGAFIMPWFGTTDNRLVLINTLGVSVMGAVGIMDDLLGSSSVKGFKGHMGHLAAGKLTTGGLKALLGSCGAAVASTYISSDVFEGILNLFIIASFSNLLNLLDLRPGRAIKSFFFIWGISYLFLHSMQYYYLLLPLAGGLIAYLPMDIKGRGMMGDAGSNALGMALGIYYCLGTEMQQKPILLAVLVLLQVVSEKYSFTKIIDRNKILRYIDCLGTGGLKEVDDKGQGRDGY